MTPETRQRKIESYGRAYDTLIAGLQRFPEQMWGFRDQHGCWSVREHLAHLTDREANPDPLGFMPENHHARLQTRSEKA